MKQFIILLLIIVACKSSQTSNGTLPDLSEVKAYLGESFETFSNNSETYALYTVTTDNKTVHPRVKYVVFDLRESKIIEQGLIRQGYIKWIDDSSIELMNLPGVIKDGQSQEDFIKTIKLPKNNQTKL